MNSAVQTAALDAVRLEIVERSDQLAAIEPAWTRLWQSLDGLIFQKHAWVSAWWQTLPAGDRTVLRIGLAWRGEQLIAVAPLCIRRRKGLRFLEWTASPYTDYPDFLVAPDCPSDVVQRLWREISIGGGFDLAFLMRLSPDSTAQTLMLQRSEGVYLRPNHRREVSYRVAGSWASGDEWFGAQSKKTRKNYRHSINMIDKIGKARFRLLPADEPIEPVLERLWALKRKWLEERDRASELFDNDNAALLALVNVMGKAGVLRIFVLECEGSMISVSVNFVQRGIMMAYLTTYDPEFSRASPGMLLMMDYIRWSFDHGLPVVDFLCGAEPFKQRFATQSVNLDTVIGIRTPAGAVATLVDRGRRGIKAWRERHLPPPVAADDAQADAGG